jgi:hypothetical protein
MTHPLKPALAALVASFALAGPAMANTYWAAPSGVGIGNCSSAGNACDLPSANADANTDGDEIILTPGTYTISSQLSNTHQISLHGEAGQSRPVIHGNVSTFDVLNLTGGASLSDLEVDLTGTSHAAAVELAGTGSLENVILNSSGPSSLAALFVDNASSYTVRDTVALISSSGGASSAIWTDSPLTVRNVTAIGTGTFSRGLSLQNIDDTTAVTVDAKNLIARGAQYDIFQFAGAHTAPGNTLDIDYSNYRPDMLFNDGSVLTAGAHNQTSDPIFASDGYHELAGSPTIGAGWSDGAEPPFDIDGDLRYAGATDIGADQYPLAAGAQALGQTSSTAYGCTPVGNGYSQTQENVQGLPSYTATSDGVITSWSSYVGAVDANTVAELKVLDPATHVVRAQSPVETELTANSVNTFTASPGIPIHAGDTVAVGVPTGHTVFCQFNSPLGNDAVETRVSAGGDPQPGDSTSTGGGGGGLRVNVQAYVEPDADHDGYGDLTQDGCPTDATTHGACPTPGSSGGNGGGSGGSSGGGSGTQPPGPGQNPGSAGPMAFKGAALLSRTLAVTGGFARLGQRCDRPCSGTDTLTAVLPGGSRKGRRPVVLGRASFIIGRAGTVRVRIKLSRAALTLLRTHSRLPAALRAVARDAGGANATTRASVVLKTAKKHHHARK